MPLRKNAKVELNRRVPLFSSCSKRDLAEIASMADEVDLPEGKTLIKEGDRGREFPVLIEGTVDVRKRGVSCRAADERTASERRSDHGCPTDGHRHSNGSRARSCPNRPIV